MSRFRVLLALNLFGIVFFGVLAYSAIAAPSKKGPARFDAIEARTITLKSGDGKHTLTLSSFDTGVGLWAKDDKGRNVCIVSLTGYDSPYFGLIDQKSSDGCPIAFSLDGPNKVSVQVIHNKEVGVLSGHDLLNK